MQSKIGQWKGFVLDNYVRLVANWWQGMLTIGSAPDPGGLHLTRGDKGSRGINFGFSTISMHILTFVSLCLS